MIFVVSKVKPATSVEFLPEGGDTVRRVRQGAAKIPGQAKTPPKETITTVRTVTTDTETTKIVTTTTSLNRSVFDGRQPICFCLTVDRLK